MVMLIDAGNSRVKWAWSQTSFVPGVVNFITYEDADKLSVLQQCIANNRPDQVLIVHVLGDDFEQQLVLYCKEKQIECKMIHSSASYSGVVNAYEQPAQLGADRWVALIAAHHLFHLRDIIIIDCGTAITVDAMTHKGKHLGGVIMPGLKLYSDALLSNTQLPLSGLPHRFINNPPDVFARNTSDAIISGTVYGLAGAVRHIGGLMQTRFEQPAKWIFCGGDSLLFSHHVTECAEVEVMPELVIEGLNIILSNNKNNINNINNINNKNEKKNA